MQHLFLVRHGQSEANRLRIVAGQRESPLSQLGKTQAEEAGETLRNSLIDKIVCSPQLRAQQTADIIARQLTINPIEISTIEELKERNLGELEGQSYANSPSRNGNAEDVEDVLGVEPLEDFYARIHKALNTIKKLPYQNILIVCHNGSGRMLQTVIEDKPMYELYRQPRLENAKVYVLA
jgi:broad specificity phosphatase PhoE